MKPRSGRFRRLASAAVAALAVAGFAAAQEGQWRPAWPAVGSVVLGKPGGAGGCTGALVAPDLVLTAAHCVWSAARNAPAATGRVWFAAGREGGRNAFVAPARDLVFASAGRGRPGTQTDVALIVLARPVPPAVAAPLPLARPDDAALPLAFVGYASSDRRRRPAFHPGCQPVAANPGAVGLSCRVESGHSGAPLLGRVGGQWHIVGVMSAQVPGDGAVRAIAAIPPIDIAAVIADHLGARR